MNSLKVWIKVGNLEIYRKSIFYSDKWGTLVTLISVKNLAIRVVPLHLVSRNESVAGPHASIRVLECKKYIMIITKSD